MLLLVLAAMLAPPAASAKPLTVLALGDSLTAGHGLEQQYAFPSVLQDELRAAGYDVKVINAGVSGDTTAGGKARLAWSLADHPDAAIVELGANDGLRGLDPKQTYRNLDDILARLKKAGIPTLLTGMMAPPNLGQDYTHEFDQVFPRLAKAHPEVLFYPFFLAGVAAQPALNQDDGIHPNPKGVHIIVKRMLPMVEALLKRAGAGK